MKKVVVIGAGIAGRAAALAAVGSSEVTLVERAQSAPSRKDAWLKLVSNEVTEHEIEREGADATSQLSSVTTRFSESATDIDLPRGRLRTSVGSIPYDSLILASGSVPTPDAQHTSSRRNLYTLGPLESYLQLRDDSKGFTAVAIIGGSPLALLLAETFRRLGKKVILSAPSGPLTSLLNESVQRRVLAILSRAGVQTIGNGEARVAGVGRVEALVSGGSVYPCDAAVIVPRASPRLLDSGLSLGRHGGVLVDSEMRTSDARVFAAGDCAEVKFGPASLPMMYGSAAEVMGTVAGVNAAGGSAQARLSATTHYRIFGTELCHAGLAVNEARSLGLEVTEVVEVRAEESVCSIVFGKRDQVVQGVQLVSPEAGLFAGEASLAVSTRTTLADLAYHDRPQLGARSSDLPPLAAAARRGLSMVRG